MAETTDDKLSIRIKIADRYYPLKIERRDEEKIRRAAKMINDKILQYKQRYANSDVFDFLAMTSLQFVIKVIDFSEKQDIKSLLQNVKKIDEELGIYLNNH